MMQTDALGGEMLASKSTTIVDVRRQVSGLWIVTDSTGTRHATRSDFQAAVASRYRELRTPVQIESASGWWYKDLREISPVAKEPTEVV
jgi:hypothetical protein